MNMTGALIVKNWNHHRTGKFSIICELTHVATPSLVVPDLKRLSRLLHKNNLKFLPSAAAAADFYGYCSLLGKGSNLGQYRWPRPVAADAHRRRRRRRRSPWFRVRAWICSSRSWIKTVNVNSQSLRKGKVVTVRMVTQTGSILHIWHTSSLMAKLLMASCAE